MPSENIFKAPTLCSEKGKSPKLLELGVATSSHVACLIDLAREIDRELLRLHVPSCRGALRVTRTMAAERVTSLRLVFDVYVKKKVRNKCSSAACVCCCACCAMNQFV